MVEMTLIRDDRSASAAHHRAAESAPSTERQSPSANMNGDDVKRFLDSNQKVFERAIAEIEQRVGFFIADWGTICGFSSSESRTRERDKGVSPQTATEAKAQGLRSHVPSMVARLGEGLEEGREGADESEHDQHRARDRDRPQRRIGPAPEGSKDPPGEGEDGHGDQRLA
jgi:hypothetical protein